MQRTRSRGRWGCDDHDMAAMLKVSLNVKKQTNKKQTKKNPNISATSKGGMKFTIPSVDYQ